MDSTADGAADIAEIEIIADFRAHDRVSNRYEVMDLSREPYVQTDLTESSSEAIVGVDESRVQQKRPREAGVVLQPVMSSSSSASEASECTICLENYVAGGERRCVVTKCGHTFCFSCINQVQNSGKPCPKCRMELGRNSPLLTIFDIGITIGDASLVDAATKLGEEEKAKRIKVQHNSPDFYNVEITVSYIAE